jgi:hypothetical protein
MRQQIALPAYFDTSPPGAPIWQRLAAAQSAVGIAIFDDWDVLAGVKPGLQGSGIKLFGRVSTHKCTVAPDVCTTIIDDWFKRHADLTGIYIDEGPPIDIRDPEPLEPDWVWAYYGEKNGIYGSIKRKHPGAQVFLNCAACRDERIFTVCDIAQLVEQSNADYSTKACWDGASLPWWTSPPAGKAIAHVVHSCPDDHDWAARVAIGLSKRRGAQYVCALDGNPATRARLPAYWDAELAAVADARADPCDVIADVLPDIARVIDDLDAELASATGDARVRLIQARARVAEQHAEVKVILEECREG